MKSLFLSFCHYLGILCLLSACVTSNDRTAVPTSTVDEGTVARVATRLAREEVGRAAGRGSGQSMAPIYGENTMLLIAPIAFEDLEKDMMVAYRNHEGRRIVHRLALKKGDTWIAMGVNNMHYDKEPVTPENLIGVVYGVFNSSDEKK